MTALETYKKLTGEQEFKLNRALECLGMDEVCDMVEGCVTILKNEHDGFDFAKMDKDVLEAAINQGCFYSMSEGDIRQATWCIISYVKGYKNNIDEVYVELAQNDRDAVKIICDLYDDGIVKFDFDGYDWLGELLEDD